MRQSGAQAGMFHLRSLVEGINQGSIVLPEFQRDFDWSESDVRSLLVTVFSGWPAGSLLLLDAQKSIFRLRPFEGGPLVADQPKYAVLDGQQRLTSLYQALYGVGDNRYAVSWGSEASDLEDAVLSFKASVWNKKYSDLAAQANERLIPLSVLLTPTDFFAWRDAMAERLPLEARPEARSRVTDFYKDTLSQIHEYEFPAVVLESALDPAAIARIFERVNRTGIRLNAFDLMVAKTYGSDWNLRDEWLDVRRRHPELSAFLVEDGMPLLQAIGMKRKGDLRQSAVLQLSREEVREHWRSAAAACASVIQFVQERCGVLRREFLPYQNSLAPLIALEMDGRVAAQPELIARWFWYIGFRGALDAAANTRLVTHYNALNNGEQPKAADGGRSRDFAGLTRKTDRAFWSATACALATQFNGDGNTGLSEYMADELELGTLFSKNELEGAGDDSFRSVLNAIIVPQKHLPIVARLGARDTISYADDNGFIGLVRPQLGAAADGIGHWSAFFGARSAWLQEFVSENAMHADRIWSGEEGGEG